ncbi:hypothetical protein UFOVP244_93 [uncultured Caudovirales phage]|uniref:Uncharacterized protein n=1 Tax=uncultured Caudovirales phage TaxID=2100421 RepID=A0A6J7WWR6_9CAUD|nr:hypothetical protein UFOVP244_93 [uncultured Caudovirales phage]
MGAIAIQSSQSSKSNFDTYRVAIGEFEALIQREAKIPPRRSVDSLWADFNNAPEAVQSAAIHQVKSYTELLADAVRNKIPLTNDKQLAWFAMRKLGLIPPSDFLNHVADGDIIEIYNPEGVQIFRSFEFYKLIQYSIADITFHAFDSLWRRDQKILAQIIDQGFVKGFSGTRTPYKLEIDDHLVAEAMLLEKKTFQLSFGWLCPLVNRQNQVAAVLATSRAVEVI